MILQSIAWPDTPEDRALYFRTGGSVDVDAPARTLSFGGEPVRFDTWFNLFSYKKWKRYTRLAGLELRLEVRGDVEIALLRHDRRDGGPVCAEVRREAFSCEGFRPVALGYAGCEDADALSFSVRALSGTAAIRAAAYCAPADTPAPDAVNLALAICTYKREDSVAANMDMLARAVFDDPASPLRGHLRAYISDNGQTLDPRRFDARNVRVFPNVNSGGSGGFSRAAIEAVHDADFAATHVILMDDDISFNAWTLERNYTFLSLLRPEYAACLVGGAMLNADCRHLMYSTGDRLTLEHVENWHRDWDLRDEGALLTLTDDVICDCLAWWYCCVPVAVLRQRQYAMPFFMQFDDVEFSMRCRDLPKLTLNGLCCWHPPLEQRDSDSRCYYCYRNFSIMYCLYFPEYTAAYMKKKLTDEVVLYLFTYAYSKAHMVMRGAEDFLRGVDWLLAQDPAALNRELIARSDRILPADQQPVSFDPKDMRRNADIDQDPLKRRLRWITLNGWLLPAKRGLVVTEFVRPHMQFFFRAGTVLKYDPQTRLSMLSRRSWREALGVLKHLMRTRRAVDAGFERAAADYRARCKEMCSEAFWRKFLGF